MKYFFFAYFLIIIAETTMAQEKRIETAVYSLPSDQHQKIIPLFSGAGSILSNQSLSLHFLNHGKKYRF